MADFQLVKDYINIICKSEGYLLPCRYQEGKMNRDYIITSSPRTMLSKANPEAVFHVIFVADPLRVQQLNRQLNLEEICGYHAYKIAEETEPGKDLLFTTKILVELQFTNLTAAEVVKEHLIAEGINPQILNDKRKEGRLRAFDKGDRVLRNAM